LTSRTGADVRTGKPDTHRFPRETRKPDTQRFPGGNQTPTDSIVAARVPGPQAQGVALCSALVTVGLTALMAYNLYEGRKLSGLLASAMAELTFWRSEYASSARLYNRIYN
jgi:hypothetical protein